MGIAIPFSMISRVLDEWVEHTCHNATVLTKINIYEIIALQF